jgi:hypothetical protein
MNRATIALCSIALSIGGFIVESHIIWFVVAAIAGAVYGTEKAKAYLERNHPEAV